MRNRISLRHLLVLAAVALVALTVVSACGGDDKDKGNGGTPTVDPATPPVTDGTPGHEGDIGGATNGEGQQIPATVTPRPHDDPSYSSTAEASNDATEEAEDAADDAAEQTEEAGQTDNEPPGN